MSKLLVKPTGESGRVSHVTPESAGWSYVGFDLYRLKPRQSASAQTGDREVCLVFVTGKGKAWAGGNELGSLGGRTTPFEGRPWSVYVPQGSSWAVTAETELELAVCSAPGLGGGLALYGDLPADVRTVSDLAGREIPFEFSGDGDDFNLCFVGSSGLLGVERGTVRFASVDGTSVTFAFTGDFVRYDGEGGESVGTISASGSGTARLEE